MKRQRRLILAGSVALAATSMVSFLVWKNFFVEQGTGIHWESSWSQGKPVMVVERVSAEGATELKEDELVLGVVVESQAMAYPIRHLRQGEHANDRIGSLPICVTW